ncbi:hypothetical protein Tco_1268287 [Tanacetum coccineum]
MIEAVVTSHAVNAPSVLVSKSGTKIPSLVHASMFHDSDSTEIMKADTDSLDRKVADLQSLVSTKDLELKDLNVALSSLQSQNDGLVDQVHALEATCSEYLTALRAAFSRAIEKGIPSGLVAGIDHIKEGKNLADVVAYNHVAKADFNSTLQKLHEVDFSLLADLKSHKDASVEDIMSLLRLEGPLAAAPGMSDLQPDVKQLRVPIYRSEDQVVLGQISLSFSLSVSHSRVEQIRENIIAQRSAIIGVWTPLSETLSVQNLTGEADIPDSVPVSVATTTALSTTFASASFIPPITIEDYEIADTDGQKGDQGSVQGDAQGNAASFITVGFKKEELDTTPELEPFYICNMDSSMGKMCLGKDIIEISSDRNEGSGDWDSPECKDTTGSGGKKKPLSQMYTEEDSDRCIAQFKLCLEYEVRNGKRLVKKELMVSLRGELYLVQFIINPEEDEFEPNLILVRSFLLSANAVANFGEGTITIQPDFVPFLLSSDEEGNL